jgi:hypothetical protein
MYWYRLQIKWDYKKTSHLNSPRQAVSAWNAKPMIDYTGPIRCEQHNKAHISQYSDKNMLYSVHEMDPSSFWDFPLLSSQHCSILTHIPSPSELFHSPAKQDIITCWVFRFSYLLIYKKNEPPLFATVFVVYSHYYMFRPT